MTTPYNPLDKINLGKSVAEALLDSPAHPLAELPRFDGAGIYVIYYTGDFPAYRPMAEVNAESLRWPIYIGKAIPSGGRRGAALVSAVAEPALYKRLADHRKTVEAAERGGTLRVSDFLVRYLIVDDIWIPLGENVLIRRFKPLWNGYLDGFGNHTPGAGRFQGMRPRWDMLHPGREWAEKCQPRTETMDDINTGTLQFLKTSLAPKDSHISFG